jgi:wyosine [tRNA(Phe)-imidazoG37] synthetase (radical SAM superfamily)
MRVGRNGNGHPPAPSLITDEAAFGYPRDFLENRFVYLAISPRAKGLSVGINLNPILKCNFECAYCEIDRTQPARATRFDADAMGIELSETLRLGYEGRLREQPRYSCLPDDLLTIRHVALSGDGEPTLARCFLEAVQAVIHVRALGQFPFFKIVLITNSCALDRPEVQAGLKFFQREDEVWAKLDAGTQAYLQRINGGTISIEKITNNILKLARQRPVVIQSLFPAIHGVEPSEEEIAQYARRLKRLKQDGAEIPLVQIYSATRPMARSGCTHLPLKSLSRIAQTVRQVAGLRAEVF